MGGEIVISSKHLELSSMALASSRTKQAPVVAYDLHALRYRSLNMPSSALPTGPKRELSAKSTPMPSHPARRAS